VVEINPKTGEAKKLISIGRFAHEAATVRQGKDGRCVVYSGDDSNDQFIYKFISSQKNSLERGTLHVADTKNGKWIPLVHSDPRLGKVFKDQTEILINCREAGALVGATPQDRPEDIEIDPITGDVLIACTNNKPQGRPHGKILKIREKNNDPFSLTFTSETFLEGGEKGGFASPDNLAFDPKGNLWFTTDMSGSDMHKGALQNFGNNGLFVVMREGALKGIPIQMASAPTDSEFTGPLFSPDGKTLFLSVQHPGELSKSKEDLTSHWPSGGIPRSGVVTLQGPLLEKITLG
jgi:secreted PhoX family phosphatase